MKNIGLFGHNLQQAAHKVLNAKTPQEAKFRETLINNDKAREVVDQVDFVKDRMTELDNGKLDSNSGNGHVEVDAQAKLLGKFKRNSPGLASPLEAITAKAPEGQTAPTVTGTLKDGNMKVEVDHPEKWETFKSGDSTFHSKTAEAGHTTFALTQAEDGKVVYQAGSDVVTMNPDGTLSMSTVDDQKVPTPPVPQQGAFSRGVESSGKVLQLASVSAADFGNKVGKALGVDETAPGLRGFAGTTISLGAAMVGGAVALPMAFIVGTVDAITG